MTWTQETSRIRLEIEFAAGPHRVTAWHTSNERQRIVTEITDTGRLWVQSTEHGPLDTVIPMSQVISVVMWAYEGPT